MFKKIFKIIFSFIIGFVLISVLTVVLYKFVNPPITPLMVIRMVEGIGEGKNIGIEKKWVSYDEISPNLFRALISGEDARFLIHEGIDWKAVEKAEKYNEAHKGKRVHGASTISMQTAKNVFLWNGRNYIRKGLEAYFTVLIETIWGKKRILEVYANVIEWGDGIYGTEAASREHFHKSAKNLTKQEAALMAAVVPNPRRWSPDEPTGYIMKRLAFIQGRMGGIALPKD
jgi:monofunctional glycosyltransferase